MKINDYEWMISYLQFGKDVQCRSGSLGNMFKVDASKFYLVNKPKLQAHVAML